MASKVSKYGTVTVDVSVKDKTPVLSKAGKVGILSAL
jgi:hypothetical protein